MSAVIVRVPELNAFAASIADNDLLHFVDVSDTTDDPTGSSFRLTPAQLRTYLGLYFRALSGAIPAGEGYSNAPQTVNLNGTPYTPTPSTGQFLNFTGSTATTINVPAESGIVSGIVTAGQAANITPAGGYTVIGTAPAGIGVLDIRSDGTTHVFVWGGT